MGRIRLPGFGELDLFGLLGSIRWDPDLLVNDPDLKVDPDPILGPDPFRDLILNYKHKTP